MDSSLEFVKSAINDSICTNYDHSHVYYRKEKKMWKKIPRLGSRRPLVKTGGFDSNWLYNKSRIQNCISTLLNRGCIMVVAFSVGHIEARSVARASSSTGRNPGLNPLVQCGGKTRVKQKNGGGGGTRTCRETRAGVFPRRSNTRNVIRLLLPVLSHRSGQSMCEG